MKTKQFILVLFLLILFCNNICLGQTNTLKELGIYSKIRSLTSYKLSDDKIVHEQGVDSLSYYFNYHDFTDSIVAYGNGKIIRKSTFEYLDQKLVKKEFKGELYGKQKNTIWEKRYKNDSIFTSVKENDVLINVDTTIAIISDTMKTIITKHRTLIHLFNSKGLKTKTEVYKGSLLITTNHYEYDQNDQLFKITTKSPNNSGSSITHYKLTLDKHNNWTKRTKMNIVGFQEQISTISTIRNIHY